MEHSGLPYEMKEISLYGPNGKPDWFWDLNPRGTVPVLDCPDDGVTVADSDLILDHLVTKLSEGNNVDSHKVNDFRKTLGTLLPVGKAVVQGNRRKHQEMVSVLETLDSMVEGPYVCGDQVTVADCAAFPFLWRLNDEYGLAELGCTRLQEWLRHCETNPVFAKTIQSSWWWWW